MTRRQLGLGWNLIGLMSLLVASPAVWGQDEAPQLNVFNQLGGAGQLGGFGGDGAKVTISAEIKADKGGPKGTLIVTAEIEPDWHIYSVTQPDGGPLRSKLTLNSTPKVELLGKFQPDKPAKVRRLEEYPGIDIEEHYTKVVWSAPVKLPDGVDPAKFNVQLNFSGLSCQDGGSCIPAKSQVPIKLTGFQAAAPKDAAPKETPPKDSPTTDAPPPKAEASTTKSAEAAKPAAAAPAFKRGPHRPKMAHVNLDGRLQSKTVKPGGKVTLSITAEPLDKWHVYALEERKKTGGSYVPTLIGLQLPEGWKAEMPRADAPPVTKTEFTGEKLQYHEKKVTWSVALHAPANAAAGPVVISGAMGVQTCREQCEPPQGLLFAAEIEVSDKAEDGPAPMYFAAGSYSTVDKMTAGEAISLPRPTPGTLGGTGGVAAPTPEKTTNNANNSATADPPTEATATVPSAAGSARKWNLKVLKQSDESFSLGTALLFALIGGFSLNFMPCVLPVIGLKLIAFVQQSHGDRRRVFLLNMSYSLGLIAVFLVLATLAVVFHFGWGDQFRSAAFNIPLLSGVFVFALSMLGVWEIPIPGFVGTGKLAEASEDEGLTGAFLKGIFTTLLATPCTGPFMGSALTWAVKQPAPAVFATFTALGVGMALPYLVIGAFPNLMRFMPKPGAWMETFKQVMGFVLLATVIFMLTFIPKDYVIATATLLLGLGVACWWIGRTSIFAEFGQKATAWGVGSAMAAAIGWIGFSLAGPNHAALPWKDFDRSLVEQLVDQRKTVLVDFTANWCANCKVNEAIAFNTKKTLELVKENNVVAIKADKTLADERGEAIDQFLLDLGHTSTAIPFMVIFPGNGKEPIAFAGPVTQSMVTKALQEAGPSM